MKSFIFIVVIILFGFSCSRETKTDQFTIRGQFSDSRGEKLVLYEMGVREITPLDSSNISKDGAVFFSHTIDQPGFYLLIFPSGRRIILVLQKGEDVHITGNLKDTTGIFNLSGSEGSEQLADFFRSTMKNKVRIDSMKNVLRNHEGDDDFLRISMKADSLFSGISRNQKKLEEEFIDNHSKSLSSLIVLNYAFGPTPVLTMDNDLPYFMKLTNLCRIYPRNKHVLFHMARVSLYLNNLRNPQS